MELQKAIFSRRTVRKFKKDPVPREIVEQIIDAARYAPSACNLQLWEFIAVDDPELIGQIAEETRFITLAPVAIFVTYSHKYTRENLAWVQSASAAVQNMMLMAHDLGLGGCWVDTLGNVGRIKRLLRLPEEQTVLALVLFGYYKLNLRAPRRRSIDSVLHFNHYKATGHWPFDEDPNVWSMEQISHFQMAKIRNGAHYNKPIISEFEAVNAAIRRRSPTGTCQWLDVLPCTGIYTEAFSREFPDAQITAVEMTEQVREFIRARAARSITEVEYSSFYSSNGVSYDFITCIFRLESLPRNEQLRLLERLRELIRPQGRLVIAFTNRHSYYSVLKQFRKAVGHKGVEYALAPDPHLGPFKAITRREARKLFRETGWKVVDRSHFFSTPPDDEVIYRSGRKGGFVRIAGKVVAGIGSASKHVDPILGLLGRVQVWELEPS